MEEEKQSKRCLNCNSLFYQNETYKHVWKQKKFCSYTCKQRYKSKLKYTQQKISLRGEFAKICQICSLDCLTILEIHHIDGDRKNNNPKNLAVVCPNCHKKIHKGIIGL